MLLRVSIVCSFLLLGSIPLYGHTTVHLPTGLLMNSWVVSRFCLLQIKLPGTFLFKSLPRKVHFFFSLANIRNRLAGLHSGCVCLTFEETTQLFSKVAVSFTSPPAGYDNEFLTCTWDGQPAMILAPHIGMPEYLAGVLICISLVTNDFEDPFMCLGATHTSLMKCLFWTQVHYQIHFLQSVAYRFLLLTLFLKDQKFFLLLMKCKGAILFT